MTLLSLTGSHANVTVIGAWVVEEVVGAVVPEEDEVEVCVVVVVVVLVVGIGDAEDEVPLVEDVTGPVGAVVGEEDDVDVVVVCGGAGAGSVWVEVGDVVCEGSEVLS